MWNYLSVGVAARWWLKWRRQYCTSKRHSRKKKKIFYFSGTGFIKKINKDYFQTGKNGYSKCIQILSAASCSMSLVVIESFFLFFLFYPILMSSCWFQAITCTSKHHDRASRGTRLVCFLHFLTCRQSGAPRAPGESRTASHSTTTWRANTLVSFGAKSTANTHACTHTSSSTIWES